MYPVPGMPSDCRWRRFVLSGACVLPSSRSDHSGRSGVRLTGRVKWFHEGGGYGMIRPDAGGRNIPVHYSDIDRNGFRTLYDGERVEYKLADGPRGPRAVRVTAMGEDRAR